MRFAPHKLGKVDGLLARYAGNEDKLLRLMHRKYVDAGAENLRGEDAGCFECGESPSIPQELLVSLHKKMRVQVPLENCKALVFPKLSLDTLARYFVCPRDPETSWIW